MSDREGEKAKILAAVDRWIADVSLEEAIDRVSDLTDELVVVLNALHDDLRDLRMREGQE